MTDEKTMELFIQYKQTGDVKLRDKIAEKYLYVADIVAKKFVGRGVEYDDLRQVAALALIKGIDRFDPSRGLQFSTFITPTIAGEIKNYFRDEARIIRLPRKLGELHAKVKKFSAEFETERGIKPTIQEIATALSCAEEEVVQALEINSVSSLDGEIKGEDGETGTLYSLIADKNNYFEELEEKETLKAEMQDLSPVEQDLIRYRYYENLSQNATAMRLGMSQMSVSRLEGKVLKKLKDRLKGLV